MRMRLTLFAVLSTAALTLAGCGDAKKDPPPGAVDADTPTVNIDEGIELPDADAAGTTNEDTAKEDTAKEDDASTDDASKQAAGKEETKEGSE